MGITFVPSVIYALCEMVHPTVFDHDKKIMLQPAVTFDELVNQNGAYQNQMGHWFVDLFQEDETWQTYYLGSEEVIKEQLASMDFASPERLEQIDVANAVRRYKDGGLSTDYMMRNYGNHVEKWQHKFGENMHAIYPEIYIAVISEASPIGRVFNNPTLNDWAAIYSPDVQVVYRGDSRIAAIDSIRNYYEGSQQDKKHIVSLYHPLPENPQIPEVTYPSLLTDYYRVFDEPTSRFTIFY